MLILYSTWGCHLCEQAEQLLAEVSPDLTCQVIDIVDDEAAFSRYRTSIPVLCFGERELCWPFDALQLKNWLEELS